MNKHDIYTLVTAVEWCRNKRFDVLPVVSFLFQSGVISRALYQELQSLFTTGEACLKILMRLPRECTFQELVNALFMCNHGDLALQLLEERHHRDSSNVYSLTLTGGFHSSVANFYRTIKTHIDNCVFRDRNDFLCRMAQYLKTLIIRLPADSSRHRNAADRLLVIHCIRLETFQKTEERFSIIKDMHEGMLLTSVSTDGDALFQCKLGSTYALQGDFENSENFIRGASSKIYLTKPSFPVHYIYLNEVFTMLVQFMTSPRDDIKTRLLFLGNRGLLSTQEDEDETLTRHIKLMLLTFMISCLLGVGIDFNNIDVEITEWDRQYAKCLLIEFDRLSGDLESRREMAYCYLMSKLLHHEDRERARLYAQRANVLSENGAFREIEKRNILSFIESLRTDA